MADVSTRPGLILANIKTALEGITTAAGYWATVADVLYHEDYAIEKMGEAMPVMVLASGDETVSSRHLRGSDPLVTIEWEVHVFGLHRGRTAAEAWGVNQVAQMRHAIAKALGADRTRGGYAIDTKMKSVGWFPADFQGFDASVACTFEVVYRHQEADSSAA